MDRLARTMGLIAFGLLCTTMPIAPSHAQTPGKYSGMNSDGFSVDLIVYQNKKGDPMLGLVQASALFYCNGKLLLTNGQKLAYGAAYLPHDARIKANKVDFGGSSNAFSALGGSMVFKDGAVSGTLVGYVPFYVGTKMPPNQAEAKSCTTRSLSFQASLSNSP